MPYWNLAAMASLQWKCLLYLGTITSSILSWLYLYCIELAKLTTRPSIKAVALGINYLPSIYPMNCFDMNMKSDLS